MTIYYNKMAAWYIFWSFGIHFRFGMFGQLTIFYFALKSGRNY
jgi:hypothetical protein